MSGREQKSRRFKDGKLYKFGVILFIREFKLTVLLVLFAYFTSLFFFDRFMSSEIMQSAAKKWKHIDSEWHCKSEPSSCVHRSSSYTSL